MGLHFLPASGQRKLADNIAPGWQVFNAAWPIPTLTRRASFDVPPWSTKTVQVRRTENTKAQAEGLGDDAQSTRKP